MGGRQVVGDAILRFTHKHLCRPSLQSFWDWTLDLAAHGTNRGFAADPTTSGEAELLRTTPPCKTIVDVGAHHGEWAALARQYHPAAHLVCVEGNPAAWGALQANLDALGNTSLVRACAGETPTDVTHLYQPVGVPDAQTTTTVSDDAHGPALERMRRIDGAPTRTLDEIVGAGKVDFLKIDVEGAETSVLRGAKRLIAERRVGVVQFEWGYAHMRRGESIHDAFDLIRETHDTYRMLSKGLIKVELSRWRPWDELPAVTNFVGIPKSEA